LGPSGEKLKEAEGGFGELLMWADSVSRITACRLGTAAAEAHESKKIASIMFPPPSSSVVK
jgi:hypothetical protein